MEYNFVKLPLMVSDQEKLGNSSEVDDGNNACSPHSTEEKAARSLEDLRDVNIPGSRYYSPGPAQASRQMPDHMQRNTPSAGPIGNTSEDTDLTDAMVFLNRIKEEYADSLPIYDSFLETMRDFKFGKIDADEVCKAVRILFKDKPFLVRLFDEYLPNHLRYNDGRGYVPHHIPERHKYPQYRLPGFPPVSMQASNRGVPPGPMQMGRNGPMHVPLYLGRPAQPSSPTNLPGSQVRASGYEAETTKHRMANDFIQLVKKMYATKPIIYKQFIELLQNSKNGFDKLLSQVSTLLVDTPDLISKFERNFRPSANSDGSFLIENDPLKNIKDILAEKGVLEPFLKVINFYNQNYISADELVFMLTPIINDAESMRAFKSFIKYEEPANPIDPKKLRNYEKVGSYKIFPAPIPLNTSSALAREVLNNSCVSLSILESEDGYIFRNKNNSEEIIAKVGDERSEGDLHLDRLKYLITKLEELYANIDEGALEMDDIEMSTALVKETLRKVYESKSNEVLEVILSNPKKAIPIVLNRLHKVYKDNLAVHRKRRKFWRNVVKENYYKAYDTKGVLYRMDEKSVLSLKSIHQESETPLSVGLSDLSILEFITKLYKIMVSVSTSNSIKKIPVEDQVSYFEEVIGKLTTTGTFINAGFDLYALYLLILTTYSRYAELKEKLPGEISSNPMAVEIGYQSEVYIPDRYSELLRVSEKLISKDIDSETYEEHVRQLTNSRGYKLYDLKKIFSRIEKQVIILVEQNGSENFEPTFGGSFSIANNDGIVTLCAIENDNGELPHSVHC